MPAIETRITILDNSEASLMIRFDLTNVSITDLVVLKRNTPLEGLKSDCLVVTMDGMPVRYDGYLVKRAVPAPSEFILLKPGQTVSRDVDVSEAYDVSKRGNYVVRFNDEQLVFFPPDPARTFGVDEIKIIKAPLEVSNEVSVVDRLHIVAGKLTIGERMRIEEAEPFDLRDRVLGVVRAAIVTGGTPQQEKTVQRAHAKGYQYSRRALREMENDVRYKHWFGDFTEDRFEKVQSVFEQIAARMERTEFTYRVNGRDCDEADYAYTTDGSRVIWLCSGFWDAPDEGSESRAGTMVHEHSHCSGFTGDFKYSSGDCRELARTKPSTAIRNADNYEYYAESHFPD